MAPWLPLPETLTLSNVVRGREAGGLGIAKVAPEPIGVKRAVGSHLLPHTPLHRSGNASPTTHDGNPDFWLHAPPLHSSSFCPLKIFLQRFTHPWLRQFEEMDCSGRRRPSKRFSKTPSFSTALERDSASPRHRTDLCPATRRNPTAPTCGATNKKPSRSGSGN